MSFQSELKKIEATVNSSSLSDEAKKEVHNALLMNVCQFDLQTIKDYEN